MTPARSIRIVKLGEPESQNDYEGRSASELLDIAWQLTLTAWAFMGQPVESRLRRDVVRVVRGKG
jgi:hypothetical protein